MKGGRSMENICYWIAANGSASEWLTAIGTVGAASLSLIYSINKSKPKGIVNFESIKKEDLESNVLLLRLTNTGSTPIFLKKYSISVYKQNKWVVVHQKEVQKNIYPGTHYEEEVLVAFIIPVKFKMKPSSSLRIAYIDYSGKKYKKKVKYSSVT